MIGQKLGSFLIEEKVGEGAMGVVFRALHEKTGKPAAVKIITGDASDRAKVPERFAREADILQQFRHPNIVRFLAVGRFRGTGYFAMEFLTGGTLEGVLERRGALPWREVVDLAMQVCDALHYAHQRNVIHRDLKPSNLLLSEKGQLKLTDFGIAKDLDGEALTATGRTLGTAAYMAPEQIRGDAPVSHKTDLYALGCLLYQMLTGEVPFKGSSPVVMMHQHLNSKPPRPSLKAGNLPRALDDLVVSLMAKDFTKRPWDAEKVRVDLEELARRADRGEEIPMVFAGGDPARLGGSTQAEAVAAPAADAAATSVGSPPVAAKAAKGSKARKARRHAESAPDPSDRVERWKTIGLVALLVAGIGVIVYLLWPPGAETLYRRAEVLMRSDDPNAWKQADREILPELDRRFPDRYRSEKRGWRDRIALVEGRRRALVLEKPNLGVFSQPKTPGEVAFVSVYNEALGAQNDGDDAEAAQKWRAMSEALLKSDDPEDRKWGLVAQERSQAVLDDMAKRRATVESLMERAYRLVQDGKLKDATRLREDVIRRFGKFRDLHDLIRKGTGIDPRAPKKDEKPENSDDKPDPVEKPAPDGSSKPDAPSA